MKRWARVVGIVVALMLFAGACKSESDVGSDDLLKFDPDKETGRIGEAKPTPTPSPAVAAQASPTAAAKASAPPAPTAAVEKFFDVFMVSSSPYFEFQSPGGPRQAASQFLVSKDLTLRVTNEDRTPERSTRSFTAEDGYFDSGQLAPGKQWTFKFRRTGKWHLVDSVASYIFADIEVR